MLTRCLIRRQIWFDMSCLNKQKCPNITFMFTFILLLLFFFKYINDKLRFMVIIVIVSTELNLHETQNIPLNTFSLMSPVLRKSNYQIINFSMSIIYSYTILLKSSVGVIIMSTSVNGYRNLHLSFARSVFLPVHLSSSSSITVWFLIIFLFQTSFPTCWDL